jgi:hypothetical protein
MENNIFEKENEEFWGHIPFSNWNLQIYLFVYLFIWQTCAEATTLLRV